MERDSPAAFKYSKNERTTESMKATVILWRKSRRLTSNPSSYKFALPRPHRALFPNLTPELFLPLPVRETYIVKHSVLYFDDDPNLLEIFEGLFGDDYDVRTVSTLDDAARALESCTPEIVICDQKMPQILGTTFLSEVMSLCPDSYRILLTGQMVVGDALPEMLAGVVHQFVPKPYREEQMREILERASLQSHLRRPDSM